MYRVRHMFPRFFQRPWRSPWPQFDQSFNSNIKCHIVSNNLRYNSDKMTQNSSRYRKFCDLRKNRLARTLLTFYYCSSKKSDFTLNYKTLQTAIICLKLNFIGTKLLDLLQIDQGMAIIYIFMQKLPKKFIVMLEILQYYLRAIKF